MRTIISVAALSLLLKCIFSFFTGQLDPSAAVAFNTLPDDVKDFSSRNSTETLAAFVSNTSTDSVTAFGFCSSTLFSFNCVHRLHLD